MGTTEVASLNSSGIAADNLSYRPAISADGRFVAFESFASNLMPGDTYDGHDQIYVRDRLTGTTERGSVDDSGNKGNGDSLFASISADGRFVAFESVASNLVPGDTNAASPDWGRDVFVRDRQTGTTQRASVDTSGNEFAYAAEASISADGRFVAFRGFRTQSSSSEIWVRDRQTGTTVVVGLDSAGNELFNAYDPAISADGRFVVFRYSADYLVRDRQAGTTGLVNADGSGNEITPGLTFNPTAISGDGRFVAFIWTAPNLISGDTAGPAQAYVRDRQGGTFERVSVDNSGNKANDDICCVAISSDGRFVAYESFASNLVPGDVAGHIDVFVRDRQAGTTERVSVDSAGNEGNGNSCCNPSLSADGRFVAFGSNASNLAAGTGNYNNIYVTDRGSAVTHASGSVAAGDSVSTGSSVSPADPVGTTVTTPVAGTVTIDEQAAGSPPAGFVLAGQQIVISAPLASPSSPLQLMFVLDPSVLPPGADATTLQVFRDGSPAGDCTGSGVASPDPCVAARETLAGGAVRLTVLTSHASLWAFGQHQSYAFTGFLAPVDALPVLNTTKAGSAIPVKFSLAGNQGLGVLAATYPRSQRIPCDSTAPTDAIEQTTTAGSSSFSYDPTTGQYTYVWKTDKSWSASPGGPCRQLLVKLIDGTVDRANFKFSK